MPPGRFRKSSGVFLIRLAIVLVVLSSVYILSACHTSSELPLERVSDSVKIPYDTKFLVNENPVSEGNSWNNGRASGKDWSDVQISNGLAFSTESGMGEYRDATAILGGHWKPDQMAWATAHTVNQNSRIYEEVELRLRSSVAPRKLTGYEINFRCTSDGSQYVQIVRWNGPLGKFTYIANTVGPGLHDGDVVKAEIRGDTIEAFINDVLVLKGKDNTFAGGNPGIGFYNQGGSSALNSDFGFTSFHAEELSEHH